VVGSAPLYFGDLLIVSALYAVVRSGWKSPPSGWWIGVYIASWIPALVFQWVSLGVILDPLYGFIRNVLAVSTFFIGAWIGTSHGASRRAIMALAVGTLITAVITIAQAVPITAGMVRDLLESLAPSFAPHGYERYPNRAFAFFEAPTALAGFLTVVALLLISIVSASSGRSRKVYLAVLILIGPALIATYSRQWVPALVVGMLVLAFQRPRLGGSGAVAILLAALITSGALAAGFLNSNYLSGRFGGTSQSQQNIADRLVQPRQFLNAQSIGGTEAIVGRGFANSDLVKRTTLNSGELERLQEGYPKENSILLEAFNHGVVACILLLGFLGTAIYVGGAIGRSPGPNQALGSGLAAAIAAAVVLMGSDQYFSETLFIKAVLWLLIGWVFGLQAAKRTYLGSLRNKLPTAG
jgi:hypothetical protein